MVALCATHHGLADGNLYSTSQLRDLKRRKCDPEKVREVLPWSRHDFLVRMGGGFYTFGMQRVISIAGQSVLGLTRNSEGLLDLSLRLPSETGQALFEINENTVMPALSRATDIELAAQGGRITVWRGKGKLALELSHSRQKIGPILELVAADMIAARSNHDVSENGGISSPGKDPQVEVVREWCEARGTDPDSRIPLINVHRLSAHVGDRGIEVGDSVKIGGVELRCCLSFDNGEGAIVC